MLDNNTNKVTWVGVAIGIVAILAIGAMTLFPDAMSGLKSNVRLSSLSFSESGQNLLYFKTNTLSASDFSIRVSADHDNATVSDVSTGVINIKTGSIQGQIGKRLKQLVLEHQSLGELSYFTLRQQVIIR